jgi:DNA polymerase-1
VPCPDIDAALTSAPLDFNFKAAAEKLFAYGAPAVAKSYAELGLGNTGGGSLPLGSADKSSSPTPSPRGSTTKTPDTGTSGGPSTGSGTADAAVVVPEPVEGPYTIPLTLKQNDTSGYKAITDIAELEKYISAFLKSGNKKKLIAYDSETTSLDTFNCNILGFSLCYQAGKAVYIPLQQEATDLFGATDYITKEEALEIIDALQSTKFEGGRHERRVGKINL